MALHLSQKILLLFVVQLKVNLLELHVGNLGLVCTRYISSGSYCASFIATW